MKRSCAAIGAAIAYTCERQRQADLDRQADGLPAAALADLIASGLSGFALASALTRHFPNAKRADVYLGVGLAIAILQADLTMSRMQIGALREVGALT